MLQRVSRVSQACGMRWLSGCNPRVVLNVIAQSCPHEFPPNYFVPRWKAGFAPGSTFYWAQGVKPGSDYYWRCGNGPGSACYWETGMQLGSRYYWHNGTGVGSRHYWDYERGPGSRYFRTS